MKSKIRELRERCRQAISGDPNKDLDKELLIYAEAQKKIGTPEAAARAGEVVTLQSILRDGWNNAVGRQMSRQERR